MRNLYSSLGFMIFVSCANSFSYASTSTSQVWNFRVLLDDNFIGFHTFEVSNKDNIRKVRSNAQFDVSFLLIPVYSYRHEANERWVDDCLVNIESTTDDNGDEYRLSSKQSDGGLLVSTKQSTTMLSGCVHTFAYWDINLLSSGKLLNSQTGEYQTIELSDLGKTTFNPGGGEITAHQYRLSGKDVKIDLWYTPDNRWLSLKSTTPSGSVIRYLPDTTNNRAGVE